MGDFHEWQLLGKWVENSTEYEYDDREPFGMGVAWKNTSMHIHTLWEKKKWHSLFSLIY
jgi:hypothetical protein